MPIGRSVKTNKQISIITFPVRVATLFTRSFYIESKSVPVILAGQEATYSFLYPVNKK